MTEEKYGKKYGKITPRSPNPREILTRPRIQCMTHQMSQKRRKDPVGSTVRYKVMN